jgi:hypothetical protein
MTPDRFARFSLGGLVVVEEETAGFDAGLEGEALALVVIQGETAGFYVRLELHEIVL